MMYYSPRVRHLGSSVQNATSRGAMGYPDFYTPTRFEILDEARALRNYSPQELICVLECKTASPEKRFAAGQLLNRDGDPRLRLDEPQMISIPAAEVILGLYPDEVEIVALRLKSLGILKEWIEKESPAFSHFVPAFQIAKYPVTNGEYRVFLEETLFPEIPTSWEFGRFPAERANHPVYTVTVEAAEAYAGWLSLKTGRHFRLPREREWEYAASGGDRREFPWGNTFLPDHANTVETGILSTTPVGMFPEGNSPFGVCDMAGNVEEYVADDYAPYPGSRAPADDLALANGSYRVARGGSFTRFYDLARCKRRHGRYPKDIYVMGFRLAAQ